MNIRSLSVRCPPLVRETISGYAPKLPIPFDYLGRTRQTNMFIKLLLSGTTGMFQTDSSDEWAV